jgi:hypothetical protein
MCICLISKYMRSGTLDLQLDLGRPSRAKPSQASSMGNPQKRPKHVAEGNVKQSTLG